MKHIYLTSLHLSHGGVEFVVSQLANFFVEKGYPVTILCTYKLGEPVYSIDKRVTIKYLTQYIPNREAFKKALQSKNPLRILMQGIYAVRVLIMKKIVLLKAFKSIESGIIISSRNEDTLLLSKYGRKDVIKIAHIHHDVLEEDAVGKEMKNGYGNIDAIVLLTEELKNEVQSFMMAHHPTIRCVAIENAIVPLDLKDASVNREKSIVSVGRLHPDKGYDRLLEIFNEVHHLHPDWKLRIIGDGVLKDGLIAQSISLGLQSSVEFLGYMDNLASRKIMMKSSIFAMTSIREGFGIVLIEAMDAGLPVVSFDVRVGPRSIIQEKKTGFLIEDGNQSDFIIKLSQLITDDHIREELGKNAKEEAEKYYVEHVLLKWIKLLHDIDR